MREILFRGKRVYNGEWVEGDLIQVFRKTRPSNYSIMPQTPLAEAYQVIPETVGQYTGLTGRNGVRIFEGDIVSLTKYNGLIYKVAYNPCRFELVNSKDVICFVLGIYKAKDIEVIGNIHDNPELLEGGEGDG